LKNLVYCIPVTRLSYDKVVKSIEDSDCSCELSFDMNCEINNQNISRNLAIKEVLNKKIFTNIGLADDDDIGVLDCYKEVNEALMTFDCVYLNNLQTIDGKISEKRFCGDQIKDMQRVIEPWNIFFTNQTAKLLFHEYGEVFREEYLNLDGNFVMLKMLELGLRIKHIKKNCYHWSGANPYNSVGKKYESKKIDLKTIINEQLLDMRGF